MAVALFDRFMAMQKKLPRKILQAAGLASLLVTTRNEVHKARESEIESMCDMAEVRRIEGEMLSLMGTCHAPLALAFATQYLTIVGYHGDVRLTWLTQFALELSLCDLKTLTTHRPSVIAASAVHVSLVLCGLDSKLTRSVLHPSKRCTAALLALLGHCYDVAPAVRVTNTSTPLLREPPCLSATAAKFSSLRFGRVTNIVEGYFNMQNKS
eukprot:c34029_g1_i1.p1 GENE.c34029_g1_i1~~c34029_g1_i1.p1  ORF type:complete len:245 (+),score=50.84 c34029_g1_i1:104-736(+)